MGNNDHVTKADLKALRDELKSDMDGLRVDLKTELTELIRDTETKLLKAFYAFAESNQTRHTNNERATNGLSERLATVERRLMELEKKVNFPHAP